MKDENDKYVRFMNLRINDYKIFEGSNEIYFNERETIIVGENGSGKTILVEALVSLAAIEEDEVLTVGDSQIVSGDIEGNRVLLEKYKELIFFDDEKLEGVDQELQAAALVDDNTLNAVETKSKEIFQKIFGDKTTHQDLHLETMAAGERLCYRYAFVFALREVLRLDIPIVLDSPYDRLDEEKRGLMNEFLKNQNCQQILLGTKQSFSQEVNPDYMLIYKDGSSRIRKREVVK